MGTITEFFWPLNTCSCTNPVILFVITAVTGMLDKLMTDKVLVVSGTAT